ncbi:MAG: BatA and WFA domain-containing protein [Bryobacteraceae bacterium]
MGLLSPWFLAGALAVGIPLYVHLLRQHIKTPLPFSSLMFFERRTQSSVKHRRLRYLLLLALRLALLLLLALTFAQPFIRRVEPVASGDKRILVVVDESLSMRAGNRLADARREAVTVLNGRTGRTKAQVAALGANLRLLTEPTQEAGALRAAVESIKPTDSLGSYAEFVRAIRALAQDAGQPIEVHLISDMQESAMPSGFADVVLPVSVTLVPHPVASRTEPNWTVESVNAPAVAWDPKKTRVQVTVAGHDTPASKRTVSLVVNGRVTASKPVDVPANGRASVEFEGLDIPYGASKCEARIESGDALARDDRALFSVERTDPKRVLLVHEARDTRSPLYFRAALTSLAESAFQLEAVASEKTANLDPSRFAFVVLADPLSLPSQFQEALERAVKAGSSVWIAGGANIAKRGKVPLFDASIADTKYYSRSGERFAIVSEADGTHPSIRKSGRWEGVKFYFALNVDPKDATVVASLNDRTPLLLEKRIGEGRVLLFASTFDNVANDFPLHPAFVPFVEQTGRYLAGIEQRNSSLAVNAHVELRSARERAVSVEIIDPDGQRPLSLAQSTETQSYQPDREGFWEVRRASGRHETIAVNADRKESDLAVIPKETLDLWAGGKSEPGQTAAAAAADPAQPKPWSLWWYAMLAVLALVLAESLLGHRYLGVQREEGA